MTPAQEDRFWEAQRELTTNRAPMCCCEGVETASEIISPTRTSRIVARCVAITVICGLALTMFYGCAARGEIAPRPNIWVLWDEVRNEPYVSPRTKRPHEFDGPTACSTDMPKGLPDGMRLSCRRVPKQQ